MELKASIPREVFEESGRRGGKLRAAKLTAKQRKEIAQKAAKARWHKMQPPPLLPFPPDGPGGKPGRQVDAIFLIGRRRRQSQTSPSLPLFPQAVAA